MRGISSDNQIMVFLGSIGDVIVTNFFTLLLCLPIITAGASLTAGCTCFFQRESADQHMIVKTFFTAFKQNFKQATQAWLIILVGLFLGAGDLYYTLAVADSVGIFYLVFGAAFLFVFLSIAMWVFPLISRYENTLGEQIKNAFFLAMGRLPRTLLLWLVWVGPLVLSFLFGRFMVVYAFLAVTAAIALELWATVEVEKNVFRKVTA